MTIDLYTALKLCRKEENIMLYGDEYTHEQIVEKFDLRKIKVKEIWFDAWNRCIRFETEEK